MPKTKLHKITHNRRITGFVYQDSKDLWWYAFGKPSQESYISFACDNLDHGISCINQHATQLN